MPSPKQPGRSVARPREFGLWQPLEVSIELNELVRWLYEQAVSNGGDPFEIAAAFEEELGVPLAMIGRSAMHDP